MQADIMHLDGVFTRKSFSIKCSAILKETAKAS